MSASRLALAIACGSLLWLAGSSSAAPPPNGIRLSPSKRVLTGSGHGTVTVTNTTGEPMDLVVELSSYSLSQDGIVQYESGNVSRSSAAWLKVSANSLHLDPHASASLAVSSSAPPGAAAGDHPALLMVDPRDRPVHVRACSGILVRTGKLVRKLSLVTVSVAQRHGHKLVFVTLHNGGNVDELFARGQAHLTLVGRHRVVPSAKNEILPGTSARLTFALPSGLPRLTPVRLAIRSAAPGAEGPLVRVTPPPIVRSFSLRF